LCGYCGYDVLAVIAVAAFFLQFVFFGRRSKAAQSKDEELARWLVCLRRLCIVSLLCREV
jgi:hypothetical protein